jgi:uncharacterized membrane-anchored protein YjiN (DUF445 family)
MGRPKAKPEKTFKEQILEAMKDEEFKNIVKKIVSGDTEDSLDESPQEVSESTIDEDGILDLTQTVPAQQKQKIGKDGILDLTNNKTASKKRESPGHYVEFKKPSKIKFIDDKSIKLDPIDEKRKETFVAQERTRPPVMKVKVRCVECNTIVITTQEMMKLYDNSPELFVCNGCCGR